VRLTPDDVACWVLKSRTAPGELVPGWRPGPVQALRRCVHPTYRLSLVAPGQRCLLWVSGRHVAGVHAIGVVTAGPVVGDAGPEVGLGLHLLEEPVPRGELVAERGLAAAEVLRAPFGSNPSYLTAEQLRVVVSRLAPADLRAAGWT